MHYLIHCPKSFGSGVEAADALEKAFVYVAGHYARWSPGGKGPVTFPALCTMLTQRRIKVPAKTEGGFEVGESRSGDWDLGEVHTNLRQVEVLIGALRTPLLKESEHVHVNPTQQSGVDASGILAGKRWVLESFGGDNIKSNDKIQEDLGKLWIESDLGSRMFFAARNIPKRIEGKIDGYYYEKRSDEKGDPVRKKRSEQFNVKILEREPVCLLESTLDRDMLILADPA